MPAPRSTRFDVYGEAERGETTVVKFLDGFDDLAKAEAFADKECFRFKSCPIFKVTLEKTVTARDVKPVDAT